jgi:hypothetical protein
MTSNQGITGTVAQGRSVSMHGATPNSFARRLILSTFFCLLTVGLALADSGANHRNKNPHFGVSGGNIDDITRIYCCSGTLGSLVSGANGSLYILSNNHVLARQDQAAVGEDISQPGRIDNGCAVPPIVADFTAAPSIGSNVDAAIAELRPGAMDSTGYIEDIGIPSSTVATPSVALAVAKSGRTTGFTTGSIGAINVNVNIQYQRRCGQGQKYVVSYTNQIVINSSTFSAGGDSGSLIVTADPSHQPVGLLFAGSSTTTIGNPIGEVLNKVSGSLGTSVSFGAVGGAAVGATAFVLSDAEITRATLAKEAHAPRLMADPNIFGVGVGADPNDAGRAALIIYVARGRGRGAIASRLDDVATVIVESDPMVAYGWNMPPETQVCQPK